MSNPPASITGLVHEDALGHEGDTRDLSTGNMEGTGQIAHLSGDGGTGLGHLASLTTLVSSGADEPATFTLVSSTSLVSNALGSLYSNGEAVSYQVSGDTLSATAGSGTDARNVFTLTVTTGGTWSFNLNDQLDHVSGTGGDTSTTLQNGGGSMGALNFTALVTVTDKDHDGVTLDSLGGGSTLFSVAIQNDVPIANQDYNLPPTDEENQPWWTVVEGGNGDNSSPDFLNTNPLYKVTGNVLTNDLVGTDENMSLISFVYTNESGNQETGTVGQWANTQYGALKVMNTGDFQYISDPYSTHPSSNYLIENVTYTVRDADNDLATADFKIKVTDTESSIETPLSVSLDEKYHPEGSAPDSAETSKSKPIVITQGKDP